MGFLLDLNGHIQNWSEVTRLPKNPVISYTSKMNMLNMYTKTRRETMSIHQISKRQLFLQKKVFSGFRTHFSNVPIRIYPNSVSKGLDPAIRAGSNQDDSNAPST